MKITHTLRKKKSNYRDRLISKINNEEMTLLNEPKKRLRKNKAGNGKTNKNETFRSDMDLFRRILESIYSMFIIIA